MTKKHLKERKRKEKEKCDNLDDSKREQIEKRDSKRKKEKHDNIDHNEKGHPRKYKKKGRKLCVVTLMVKNNI